MITYLIALLVFAGAIAAWYFTKDTPVGRKVTFGALIAVALVLLLLSFKGNIPILGRIVDWFKNKVADNAIKKLDKENDQLALDKAAGIKSAAELEAKSKELANKAQDYRSTVNALDVVLGRKITDAKNTPDPAKLAHDALPALTGETDKDTEALLNELKKRNAARKGAV
jgi:hypothetical protein